MGNVKLFSTFARNYFSPGCGVLPFFSYGSKSQVIFLAVLLSDLEFLPILTILFENTFSSFGITKLSELCGSGRFVMYDLFHFNVVCGS